MIQMFQLAKKDLKITMINMLKTKKYDDNRKTVFNTELQFRNELNQFS